MEAAHDMSLTLLKGFTLSAGQSRVPVTSSAQQVIAFLALRGRPCARSEVAGTLWSQTPTARANANLRSTLWRVQQSGHHVVDVSAQEIAIADHIQVDIREAIDRAHRILNTACSCEEILTVDTLEHLSADLLPNWYDSDWILIEQERYHQLRLYGLEAMAERYTAAGRHGEAVAAALAAVRAEPLRETAHRVLILAHLAAGNRCEAVRQYQLCRQIILDELGLEPSLKLDQLLLAERSMTTP